MREIKIRAWDKSANKFRGIKGVQDCFNLRSDGTCNNDYILMQYIGLKDKNGVEIYEGDIVKYKTYYYSKEKEVVEEVKWIEGGYTDLFGEPSMYGFLVAWRECEIIGNIFENPEIEIDKPFLS